MTVGDDHKLMTVLEMYSTPLEALALLAALTLLAA